LRTRRGPNRPSPEPWLDDQSRTRCILIAVEGLAYDEVSKRLSLPLGSIGPMYLRAKSKMGMQMAA
jgi:DNA-directed RNA polymerase specialized sigma24 family protein